MYAYDEWQQQLHKTPDVTSESGGKLVLYRDLQPEPQTSGYITTNISRGRRWVMAACRGGCLPLARWHIPKLPLAESVCQQCDSGDVEDIPHFILFCAKYNLIRNNKSWSIVFLPLCPSPPTKRLK